MAHETSLPLSVPAAQAPVRPAALWLRRAVWALALAGLLLRLAFALLPLATHLIVLEDDAWMVTAIARHFALGHGITADGVNPTTGFQPLYPLTLGALPYLVAPNALDAGFTANLIICALLNTLATWPLWWLARRFGGELAGLLAVALFALNPYLVRVSVNAMETSMGLLLLLTLFVAFYRLDLARARNILLLALLTALATLTRLDACLAFAAIAATLGWRLLRTPRAEMRAPALMLGVYTVATLLLLAPYFAFNHMVGGSWGPSSGNALAYMHSYGPGRTPAEGGDFHITNGLNALSQSSALDLSWLRAPWQLAVLMLGLAGLLLWLIGARLLAALPLLLYLPIPPLYYGYLLQQARERYFVGISAVLIILLAWLGAELWRRWPMRPAALALAATAALIIALNTREALLFYRTKLSEPSQTQPTLYQAAIWARDNLPASAVIGAKNSGLLQYYSGHTVLNIDGKLNHEIVPVMERRDLLGYLRAQHVEYLIDREEIMAHHIAFYSAELGSAPNHHAPSLTERAIIYGKIVANLLGAHLDLQLESRDDFTPTRPFSTVAEIIKTFERSNQTTNPVVVYRLIPTGAAGAP